MTQETQQFIFQLTLDDCNTIFAGLGEIPTKLGKPLMDKMQYQFAQQAQQAQQAEPQPATPAPEAEPAAE